MQFGTNKTMWERVITVIMRESLAGANVAWRMQWLCPGDLNALRAVFGPPYGDPNIAIYVV